MQTPSAKLYHRQKRTSWSGTCRCAKDVTAAKYEYIRHTITAVEPKVDTIRPKDVDTAAQMIAAAKKPFIFVGGGAVIADASEEVRALAHKIQAPVCDSLMGKGLFRRG